MKKDLFELKLKEESIEIEGNKIIVKELTAGEASKYQHSLYTFVSGKPVVKVEAAELKLIILTCHDEEGNKYFEMSDLENIKKMPSRISEQLYNIAKKLNDPPKEEVVKN